MFSTFGTILLMISLLLGGGGVTAVAAQSAQPDGLLYPVKTWSEEARYTLAEDDAARLELALQFADRRMAEIQVQLEKGQVPGEALQTRLQNQLELALALAAGQPVDEIPAALQRIQAALQNQLRVAQGWASTVPAGEQVVLRVRAMLQERLALCAEGLQDPLLLRERLQNRRLQQEKPPVQSTQAPQGATGQPDPTRMQGLGPTAGTGQNPWTTGTPTPGSGYGPGPGDNQNPGTDLTPTPGSGYGPGPGDGTCETCTPGSGSGQQATCTLGSGGQMMGTPGSGQPATGTPGSGGGNKP